MRIVVFNHVTLDGVMQSPGGPEEDPRGGFQHGGWGQPSMADAVLGKAIQKSMASSGALLLGRFTYQAFHAYWPRQKNNPFTDVLNATTKYVASRSLAEPLPWVNSVLLKGDAAKAVARLKQQPGRDLVVLGSGDLIQSLMRDDLVDEYTLLIHPRVLGSGRRLFPDGCAPSVLKLAECITGSTGLLIATYRPERRR
jgi:dihydrofolate reductase